MSSRSTPPSQGVPSTRPTRPVSRPNASARPPGSIPPPGSVRPPPMGFGAYLGLRLMRSLHVTWGLLALETAIFALLLGGQLASMWELQWGILWLAPTWIAASALIAPVGTLIALLLDNGQSKAPRTLLAVLSSTFAGFVGWGVGGGRHLATVGPRLGFAAFLALLCGLAAWVAVPPAALLLKKRPRKFAMASGGLIVALELANQFVLVRLYPAFHQALALATVLLASVAVLAAEQARLIRFPSWKFGRYWGAASALLVVASAGFAEPLARKLAYFDNFRLLLSEQAPLLGQAVQLAATLAPPAPLELVDDDCFIGSPDHSNGAGPATHALELRGRDLLFITIDAVRADHVGLYGYARRTTPNLDALGSQGVVFDHAYCATPHTSYSLTSMMTGKYMRPLLLQGAGQDSDTIAGILRTYGYRTAAFYPPAVFFIDGRNFEGFRSRALDFEYSKVEFLEGPGRVAQVKSYLDAQPHNQRLFVWVHLFGPHEPYEAHPEHAFGDRDIDRYDSEIAAADATVGELVKLFRKRSPSSAVVVTSDHGEEFGDHGGRYHGTSVYEEQVRVPMVLSVPAVPGAVAPKARRIAAPVQTIDLLPTVLTALEIPRPPRVRGRDWGPWAAGEGPEGPGFAHAETEEQALLAEGTFRLLCAKRLGACKLYDLATDPSETVDISSREPTRFEELRKRLRELGASHGRFEVRGLRTEGKGWPDAILRGVAGDADAAEEIAALLDDADRQIRRKAAELLFQLKRPETSTALRLALARDEDIEVRRWAALTLTRLGEGAPLAYELVDAKELQWRRLAALALAEAGDGRGGPTLLAWWKDSESRDYLRSRELLDAFGKIRFKDAVWPLVESLGDVRLRPYIASSLAAIGEEVARGPLARALANERYQGARVAIAEAMVKLKAEGELAQPLVRFLGVPDPLVGGLGFAVASGILEHVGGPDGDHLKKLRREHAVGVAFLVVVPRGGNGTGVRVVVRARNGATTPGEVLVGPRQGGLVYNLKGEPINARNVPKIDPTKAARVSIPPSTSWVEAHALVPEASGFKPGHAVEVIVFAQHNIDVDAVALVPLADELPPPPPEPWVTNSSASQSPPLPAAPPASASP